MTVFGSQLAFVDVETTGLDADWHEVWEVGLIVDDTDYVWQLPVDVGRAEARALDVSRFHQRRLPEANLTSPEEFATAFEVLTWGRHLVGCVVSFDEERLRRLLRTHGACPGWHYRPLDVEALVLGYLAATGASVAVPFRFRDLADQLGVEWVEEEAHTALGDARFARDLWRAVMGER